MSLILGFDVETTGLNTRTDYITELGAALYDTDARRILKTFQRFVLWPGRPIITPEITELTGITNQLLEMWGTPSEEVFADFFNLADSAEYMVAHNCLGFDKLILESNILRIHDPSDTLKQKFYGFKWIDTAIDIPYPKTMKSRGLKNLAHDHDYHMKGAHTAVVDVYAMLHILSCYDFSEIEKISHTAYQTVIADVSFQDRQKAKDAGFYWDADKKQWQKRIRQYFLNKNAGQMNFPIKFTDGSIPVGAQGSLGI